MEKFVAFLRGINVGGNKKVPMSELKLLLEKSGFKNVKTVLASGNVIFEREDKEIAEIQNIMEKYFGFSIPTIVVPFDVISRLTKSGPFQNIDITKETVCYVTLSNEKTVSTIAIPSQVPDQSFQIIHVSDVAVFSVIDKKKIKTTEVMKFLEKEFGKTITTRNYNTILKIANL